MTVVLVGIWFGLLVMVLMARMVVRRCPGAVLLVPQGAWGPDRVTNSDKHIYLFHGLSAGEDAREVSEKIVICIDQRKLVMLDPPRRAAWGFPELPARCGSFAASLSTSSPAAVTPRRVPRGFPEVLA